MHIHADMADADIADALLAFNHVNDVILLYTDKLEKCRVDDDAAGFLRKQLSKLNRMYADLKGSTNLVLNSLPRNQIGIIKDVINVDDPSFADSNASIRSLKSALLRHLNKFYGDMEKEIDSAFQSR